MKEYLSTKELAALLNPENPGKEYSAIKKRLQRNFYSNLKKSGKKILISINDPKVPLEVRTKYMDGAVGAGIQKKETSLYELSEKQTTIALARVDLLKHYLLLKAEENKSLIKIKKDFVKSFNLKALPALYNKLGKISFPTVERWKKNYLESGKDYRSLAPRWKPQRGSHIPPEQSKILISLALNPNRPKIAEVVRQSLEIFIARNYQNIKSAETYKRFLADWRNDNYAMWTFYREGNKALNDKCLPYIERDYDQIEVGDILVADGHVLNFEIINPFTGKPKRMTLVLFLDMKSNFPLGWEITPTENVFSIAVALRRSIIRLGKYPKIIYIDNGKAFGAKFFKGIDFDSSGITGLFERIGAEVITAWPYHAQSKTVERFFGSFAELERMIPTYTGTSIQLQPPRMNRGETLHRNLHERIFDASKIDLWTAHRAVAWWFDKYVERPQQDGHLKNTSPIELFDKGKGPGIDKKELIYLMMKEEVKTIYRNGIRMLGSYYWHEELFGLKSINAVVRFDLIENDSIYVFDADDGSFICEAVRTDKVHPAAGILGTKDDVEKLNKQISLKRELTKNVTSEARKFLKEEIYPSQNRQLEEANILQITDDEPDDPKNKKDKKDKQRLEENIFKMKFDDEDYNTDDEDDNSFFNLAAEE